MPPPLFQPCTINSPFNGTLYNANMVEAEASLADLGPYVITGLTISAGTGLSAAVAAGTASIGGRVTLAAPTTAAGLTDSTVNHIYILNSGAATSNTTGTAPANSAKLGTATTAGGVVTSVAMGRTSGRQQFQQPQNLVLGGAASGITSAGHPRAANLAQWNATQAEGFEVFGVLPSGAVPATSPPVTYTLNDANQNTVQTVLTLEHTYNAGGGATGIGTELDFSVETSTNGTNKIAANLQATLTDLTPATATGKLAFRVIANNAQVTPLTVATGDIRIPQATVATSQHGLLNIGSGGFDGSGGHFTGDSPGTLLALNAPSGYSGTYIDVQKNAVRLLYLDQFGTLFRLSAPVGTANDGQLSLGPDFAHFDGSSGGHFVGNANGQYLAINTETGFAGDLVRFQHHGSDRYRQTDNGDVTVTYSDAGTSNEPNTITLQHRSSGTPTTSFGNTLLVRAHNGSNTDTDQFAIATGWSSATAGSESSLAIFSIRRSGVNTEVLRLNSTGNGRVQLAQDFAHVNASGAMGWFNTTPATKQSVTGSRAGNAALASLLSALAAYGIVTDSSTA
jgi:hypothetical protein